MRVGREDRRVHRLASDDGSTFGAAHDIEVGWCRLVRRTELQWAHDVHHLAAQRFSGPATSSCEQAAMAAHSDGYSNHPTI